MHPLLVLLIVLMTMLLGGALALHLIPRFGSAGKQLAEQLCKAPLLDLVITYFTVLPLVIGSLFEGWLGLLTAAAAMVASTILWGFAHEMFHFRDWYGPRIVKTLNRIVGRWRNHAAVWITALAVPLFWLVRVAELVIYPPLTRLVGLPKYRHADWVNVSRHKFKGLVGHDLIWCLYCDWMTGVWSLGSEMLRNVESFWCPIRFASPEKCENCRVDFPDVQTHWVRADGDMTDVAALLERQYSREQTVRAWFGHPVRLTVSAGASATTAPRKDTAASTAPAPGRTGDASPPVGDAEPGAAAGKGPVAPGDYKAEGERPGA